MLKRFQKIRNVGRFIEARFPGCEFSKDVVIFGKNTQGKSTLTAILRSLRDDNRDLVTGRKTLGAAGPQEIEIDFETERGSEKRSFKDGAWDASYADLLIFDSRFVAENICDGESVFFEHQQNLSAVIIGERGKALAGEISSLHSRSEEISKEKAAKTAEFSRSFPGLDLAEFRALKPVADVDQKIEDKKKQVLADGDTAGAVALAYASIRALGGLGASVREALSQKPGVRSEDIDAHVRDHFAAEPGAHEFLSSGLKFLRGDAASEGIDCVFCGQPLGDAARRLVKSYEDFFSGAYRKFRDDLSRAAEAFERFNLEAILGRIAPGPNQKGLGAAVSEAKVAEILALKAEFGAEISKKRSDFEYAVDFSSLDRLESEIAAVSGALEAFRASALSGASSDAAKAAAAQLKGLEVARDRHTARWADFCDSLRRLDDEAASVRRSRDEKRDELERHSAAVFLAHGETINAFCQKMGADFEIDGLKPIRKIVGKSERLFDLKFFGSHRVDIASDDESRPNFRNTLSESDKRLLAFAFFLSLLAHDDDLGRKIVVLDDPLSSFDGERRRATLALVADIASVRSPGTTPRQRIVLTHDDRFATELRRLLPDARTLKIVDDPAGGGLKASTVAHADFDKDFPEDSISPRIEKVEGILERRSFAESFETDCRIVLEHVFKRKYFRYLRDAVAQRKGVRTFVGELHRLKVGGFDDEGKFRDFIRICDDLNIESHDGASGRSDGDKESLIRDFFARLESL